jgi:hypothetical protein
MNITKEERMNILNSYIGNGNPSGKYWFMGIEEGGGLDIDNDKKTLSKRQIKLEEICSDKYKEDNPYYLTNEEIPNDIRILKQENSSKVLQAIKYFYSKLENEIQISDIGNKNVKLFQLNLRAIPSRTTKLDYSIYKDFLGVESRKEYDGLFYSKRKEFIMSFLQKYFFDSKDKKYLFCFGKTAWVEFSRLINEIIKNQQLNDSYSENLSIFNDQLNGEKRSYIHLSINQEIFLLYHPSRGGLTNKIKDEIISKIRGNEGFSKH